MIPDCTLVTACFDITKYNSKSRNFEESINNMKALLETPCYLVIYTDESMVESIKLYRNKFGLQDLTIYIIKNVEELDSFKYVENVRKNRKIYHPTNDARTCSESHLVCCSKFELVLNTINSNPFKTSKFGWIDANIGINFSKICTNYKNNMLLNVLENTSQNKFHLQILNVNDKKYIDEIHLREYYSSYKWVVCGCLFICGKEIGIKILTELNNVFIKHTMLGYGHGEEMFYLEILDKYYNDIERSYGDYQHILNNFIDITTGIEYIKNIARSYMNRGYHKECIDCCDKIIKQYENYNIDMNYSLYFDFLFMRYVSMYYFDNNKAKPTVVNIHKLIEINPFIKDEYNKNKQFYDTQFNYSI